MTSEAVTRFFNSEIPDPLLKGYSKLRNYSKIQTTYLTLNPPSTLIKCFISNFHMCVPTTSKNLVLILFLFRLGIDSNTINNAAQMKIETKISSCIDVLRFVFTLIVTD